MNLFQNALVLAPQNVSVLVLYIAAAVWAGIVVVLLTDLIADSWLALWWKIIWLPIIICVPVISGLLYGGFSLIRSLAKRSPT
jgi:hypothetical protein